MRPEGRDPSIDDRSAIPRAPSQDAPDAAPSRARILVVEDNQVNVLILRAMLRKCGHEPAVARDGAEGVELAERLRPDLVLMDLQMPRLDGLAAAAEIGRRMNGSAPCILAVTANVTEAVDRSCRSAGFAGVLAKPIVFQDLSEALRRHLRAP